VRSIPQEGVAMEKAVVLITVQAGTAEKVRSAVEKIENVTWALMVIGPFDIIAYVELPSRTEYRRFIERIHDIAGVQRTETCIAI
jgi:DNA-binding Lrp family transcriptional regulator